MIEIDGSFGEAGGQILRTALSLSCLLQKPFRMFNIRKKRKKPGLMPQHLMCVQALARISDALVQGDSLGSAEISFEPSAVKSGNYFFDIGTAGSTSLLLQSLLPPLFFAKERSFLKLTGGTHVPFSPPFQYIHEVFIPTLHLLGYNLNAVIEQYGFYPKGGGRITVEISPVSKDLRGVILLDRGELKGIYGISGVGNLPLSIAERQKDAAQKYLLAHGFKGNIETLSVSAFGQGTFLFLKTETDKCIAGFSSLGERGKKAEKVGEEAAHSVIDYLSAEAFLDHHLADQIILYLAIAEGESSFSTSCITDHILTNLQVIQKFLEMTCSIKGEQGKPGTVSISGKSCAMRNNKNPLSLD